jgi:segregation and condensation protein B
MTRQADAARAGRAERPRKRSDNVPLDIELVDLPPELRWREWMQRVEAVIFASATPVSRDTLARVVGRNCSIDLLIDDLREELRGRPYELVSVAGGWQHRTKPAHASVIRASGAPTRATADLTAGEAAVLMAIGYFQPVTRAELSKIFGKEISRDLIGNLRSLALIASGPRSPQPGAPYTYVTTPAFLSAFGFDTLRDLPDIEMLEDAGLLSRDRMMAADLGTSMSEEGDEQ